MMHDSLQNPQYQFTITMNRRGIALTNDGLRTGDLLAWIPTGIRLQTTTLQLKPVQIFVHFVEKSFSQYQFTLSES